MNERQHTDGPEGLDTDDLGFRDGEEERAYAQARGEQADKTPTSPAEDAVDAQAEPDDGEPANAG